jgi:uncharacterized protein with beta-barrel porin domain
MKLLFTIAHYFNSEGGGRHGSLSKDPQARIAALTGCISRVGNSGKGTVSGGDGDDSIMLSGDSSLGNNSIGGNPGSSGLVSSDTGNDTITLIGTRVGRSGAGTVSGGDGNDLITLSGSSIGNSAGSSGQVLGDAGNDTITLNASFVGSGGAGTVSGGLGDDLIALSNHSYVGTGFGTSNRVLGDAGNDTITLDHSYVARFGSSTVSGGADNDSIVLSYSAIGQLAGGSGQVLGDAGNDTITLDASVVGLASNGTVSGGMGDDSIALSNGSTIGRNNTSTSNQVLGDAGNDTITLDHSYVGDAGAGTVSGGANNDSIALSNSSQIGANGGSSGQVLGDAGNDTITVNYSTVGNSGSGTVSGGDGNDSIALGLSGNTTRIGGAAGGSGQVLGDAGNDTITLDHTFVGYSGAGTVSGGDGDDSIALSTSQLGRDPGSLGQVLGDAGNDTITINHGYVGNAGSGTVDGGDGNDSIALSNGGQVGFQGQVLGGAGNDTVAIDSTITRAAGSIIDGGADTDLLKFTALSNASIGPGEFLNFEQLQKLGSATLTLTGNQTWSDSTEVVAGTLNVAGVLTSALTTVDPGATLMTTSGSFIGDVTNQGNFSPGRAAVVESTSISGAFTQTASGNFAVDINGALADHVQVAGTATVDGFITPNVISLGSSTQWAVINAGAPIVNSGIAVNNTAAVQFGITFPTPEELDLILLGVNFALQGQNHNEQSIAKNLNAIFAAGVPQSMQNLFNALGNLGTAQQVAKALDQLSPEVYLDTEIAALYSSLDFTSTMLTCPTREGTNAFIKEGECVWARVKGRQFDQDATFQTFGFDETSFQVAAGAQFALAPNWRLGGAFGYEHSNLETDSTNAKAEGDRFSGGMALKYNPGALLLAGGVSGTLGNYDTKRPIAIPGFSALSKGDDDIDTVDGRFRAAYLFTSGAWYLKPMVDLDAVFINLDNVNERGAGGAGLNVHGDNETVLSAEPMLELGTQFATAGGTLIRPYVRGGATFFDGTDFALQASFEGTPDGVGPFRIVTNTDNVVGDVGAGVDLIGPRGAELKLYYEGRFGDLVSEQGSGLKASLPF